MHKNIFRSPEKAERRNTCLISSHYIWFLLFYICLFGSICSANVLEEVNYCTLNTVELEDFPECAPSGGSMCGLNDDIM